MRIEAPKRVSHTYRQRLNAQPEKVFPLLCPVRETEWAVGWAPSLVLSRSGVVENDCVFITPAESGSEAIWYVTRHEPEALFVEMLKITPGMTACRLQIQLHPERGQCLADVTYSYTSLGPEGDELVTAFTAERYAEFMRAWEAELNHFLATGRMLGASGS
jgi:hypothetical protein